MRRVGFSRKFEFGLNAHSVERGLVAHSVELGLVAHSVELGLVAHSVELGLSFRDLSFHYDGQTQTGATRKTTLTGSSVTPRPSGAKTFRTI